MSKKVVLKLEVRNEKEKQKAMKAVSSLEGVQSLSMDMNEKKLTVIGNVDPVKIVGKLKRCWFPQILTVGPPKEPEKDKGGDKSKEKDKDGGKKTADEQTKELLELYKKWYPHYTQYYHVYSAEENPNSCVIC